MSIETLKSQMKNNKLGNLYLFYGHEEYLKKKYIKNMEELILSDEGLRELNKTVIEGKTNYTKIIDACETLPVFSDKRLVIVKNSGLLKSKGKSGADEAKGKSKSDDLVDYLKNIPEHVCLVFYEEDVDKRIKIVDMVKKNGLLVEFAFQKPEDLTKWVGITFAGFNKKIDSFTASQIVECSDQGMSEIYAEIMKLVMYTGDRAVITSKDVQNVCTKSLKVKIFDLTDALAAKDKSKAFKVIEDMVIMKEPLPRAFFMIAKHFGHILQMKLLSDQGMNVGSAASKMGITTYAAGKILKQSKGFTIDRLKAIIKEIQEYDLAIKTGRMKERIATELMINSLAT